MARIALENCRRAFHVPGKQRISASSIRGRLDGEPVLVPDHTIGEKRVTAR